MEATPASAFAVSDGQADQPKYEKHSRHDPEEVEGEAESRKKQYQQKRQQDDHGRNPFSLFLFQGAFLGPAFVLSGIPRC